MARQAALGKTEMRKTRRTSRRRLLLSLLVVTASDSGLTYRSVQQGRLNHALANAVERNDITSVCSLLRQGADSNARLIYQNTPRTPMQLIQWLIRSPDIIWEDEPVLLKASQRGDLQMVNILYA